MKFSSFLLGFTFLTLSVAAQNKKPNIIFVLADDLGIDGVSSYGADLFKTPEIDKLAKNGIRYTNPSLYPLSRCSLSQLILLMSLCGKNGDDKYLILLSAISKSPKSSLSFKITRCIGLSNFS